MNNKCSKSSLFHDAELILMLIKWTHWKRVLSLDYLFNLSFILYKPAQRRLYYSRTFRREKRNILCISPVWKETLIIRVTPALHDDIRSVKSSDVLLINSLVSVLTIQCIADLEKDNKRVNLFFLPSPPSFPYLPSHCSHS